jgi:hypothetical protein
MVPSPSTVSMTAPSASTARIMQELTLLPSMMMVHAPHSPAPQPSLVPVRPTSSRMKRSRVVFTATSLT